ncbi:hypothetical protein EYF80_063186 [Liparis tanakae]|uniref:Ig-like domain-containing protein n=1 Tax=Liparis tanakae TaxID=230148 RepID=A0A4Z2ECW5_9TELE|nr:hypothetical protein EYF80_063186 [Liparis tanakae]
MASRTGSMAQVVLVVVVLIRSASESHHATVGHNVTLSCDFKPPSTEGESVVWTLNASDVLVFRSSAHNSDDQAARFRGRASPGAGWAPAEGRAPVTLSNVTEADGGTYSCSVGKGTQKRWCSTRLSIWQSNDFPLTGRNVEKQAGEKPDGEKQAGEKQAGEKPDGEKQAGEKQAGFDLDLDLDQDQDLDLDLDQDLDMDLDLDQDKDLDLDQDLDLDLDLDQDKDLDLDQDLDQDLDLDLDLDQDLDLDLDLDLDQDLDLDLDLKDQ